MLRAIAQILIVAILVTLGLGSNGKARRHNNARRRLGLTAGGY